MIIVDYIKRTFSNNTNVRGWTSWESIKENGKVVADLAKGVNPETDAPNYEAANFKEAMKHYGLTEADLKKRMRTHFLVAITCALLGLVALVWGGYLLSKTMFLSTLVALALAALMFVYAFREHLFYTKIKERRLNITVKEWFKMLIPGRGK